jgi:hypothetical protein
LGAGAVGEAVPGEDVLDGLAVHIGATTARRTVLTVLHATSRGPYEQRAGSGCLTRTAGPS